jgi:GTP-binding protein EngB required for normal cell division
LSGVGKSSFIKILTGNEDLFERFGIEQGTKKIRLI